MSSEVLSALGSSISEAFTSITKEVPKEIIKEVSNRIIESGKNYVLEHLDLIRGTTLESLKLQNESSIKQIKENKSQIEINRENGYIREELVNQELKEKYPEAHGFKVLREQYLRDFNGQVVKDRETGEKRRIDFLVTKENQIIKSIEVTSETASKENQISKEERIRESGGNYARDPETNKLITFATGIKTEVVRRP